MDITFPGKTALVTGAGSGIGEAIAQALATSGAQVVMQDLNEDGAARVAKQIEAKGGKAKAAGGNVADPAVVEKLITDAKLLEELGCFALVLEKIPADLAKKVSESITIPTIGIGAGPHCDGQVLVYHDMVGMNKDFSPKFLRRYLDLYTEITGAVSQYVKDVKSSDFPNQSESY